jgi:rhodanese-related sulfurtransferase
VRRLPLAVLAAAIACGAMAAEPALIEPKTLVERLAWGDRSLVLLDVRTPAEYADGHIPGAINIPHSEIASRISELSNARDRDLVVYCRSGNRTGQALASLREAGFSRLFHLNGDYLRWSEEKRPVTGTQ